MILIEQKSEPLIPGINSQAQSARLADRLGNLTLIVLYVQLSFLNVDRADANA
jgi:hypothetical protein